jgi:hypothetical protein
MFTTQLRIINEFGEGEAALKKPNSYDKLVMFGGKSLVRVKLGCTLPENKCKIRINSMITEVLS